jgi:hypothetical protein
MIQQVATLSGGGPGAEEPPCVDCHVQPRTSLIQLGPLPLAKQASLVDITLQATEALPRNTYSPNQASNSQPNGLKLSREAPTTNALDQMKQGHAERASSRRNCQDNAAGASSDPTLS